MEPRLELPAELVAAAVWADESEVFTLEEVRSAHWREVARIENESATALTSLRWLGDGSREIEPIELIVRGDESERLVVTDSRIEISADVVMAHGQLTKAFLKSFLLQRGSTDLVSSHLRLDIVSDVLLGMSTGRLDLEVPGHDSSLKFDDIKPWWAYAQSYRGVCDSDWRSIELLPICRAKDSGRSTVSMLSFRPLIGAILWNAFNSQPVAQRYAFAQKWARSLARTRAVETKGGTKERLNAEIETLLPMSEFPEAMDSVRRSLTEARMLERASLEADLLIRMPVITNGEIKAVQELLKARPRLAVFARTKDGLLSFPGGVAISGNDLQILKVKHEVFRSCDSPKLLEVAHREVPTKRLIWVKTCEEEPVPLVYAPLLAVGVEGFARANPTMTFIQLKPEGVEFAIRSGRASPIEGAEALVKIESKARNPWFGLQSAAWIDAAHAFRVNGAIEAVEWHRTAKAPKVSAEF